ncbi:MAG TPA: 23S rRNA (cytidine(2498)-2'-O)-methyltransferase RlmM [Gammaproteobacteria bacterium]|nr:23S rRNA (cytidine(2498)-2'-O)-methyltransferase RlmM [Gammaproteobacteria bacterium]
MLYCRPGFEKECASEIQLQAQHANLQGYIKTKPDSGYVQYILAEPQTAEALNNAIRYNQLVFTRQCIFAGNIIKDLPVDDRITPLVEQIKNIGLEFNDLYLETPDTNDGKQMSGFCKKFFHPLIQNLKRQSLMNQASEWRLHIFFLSSSAIYIGIASIHNSAADHMGILRLQMPRNAPSRSTLKLEEAFKTLLSEKEQQKYLRTGMTSVDLGASPGGWTWQMVQRNIKVIAIDNGNMDPAVMDSGLVVHQHADGFVYTPPEPVDWLLCDMVERPLHIARLIARWLVDGHCKHAVFNLKLPMKQRYQMVEDCRSLLETAMQQAGIRYEIRMKQLYHDREEITCIVIRH